MIKAIEDRPVLTIVLCVVIMLGFSIHHLDVTIMEARNFITAREMLTDGNWLLTTMNGEPRYQKPPLPTWFAAFAGYIFGFKSILALRFPGIIMVAILGISTYIFSKKFLNDSLHALINALITISSFYVIAIIIEAPWDIFTHTFMLIGILNVFLLFEKQKNYWKHTIIAGLFIGLSILCKGPVSFYALFLPFLIAYGIVFKFKGFKSKAFSLFSVLIIALMVGGWWYLYVRIEDPATLLAITEKETGNWSSYNVRPFYYYWSFFVQSGLWTIPAFISLLYPYMKTRVSNLKAYRFSFFWTLFAVILLSIIPEKKSRYLMPVLIPLAINIGFYIDYLIRKFKSIEDKRESLPVYFNFGLIALIGIAFPFIGFFIKTHLTGIILIWYIIASIILVTIGVFILIQLRKKNIKNAFYLCIVFLIGAFIFVLPLSDVQKSDAYRSISDLPTQAARDGLKVYSLQSVSPEILWEFGDKISKIKLNDSTYDFPKETQFGLLSGSIDASEKHMLDTLYHIELKDVFDLNKAALHSKKHRARLRNNYYVFTKK